MCMVNDGDGCWEYYQKRTRKAIKEHKCAECGRKILPKEKYVLHSGFWDREWYTSKTCLHCYVAAEWLAEECGGYLFGSVSEDLEAHFREGYKQLGRLVVGMRRQWKRFKSDELMEIIKI